MRRRRSLGPPLPGHPDLPIHQLLLSCGTARLSPGSVPPCLAGVPTSNSIFTDILHSMPCIGLNPSAAMFIDTIYHIKFNITWVYVYGHIKLLEEQDLEVYEKLSILVTATLPTSRHFSHFPAPLFLALCQTNSLHSHFSSDLSLLNICLFSSCALRFPHRLPLSSRFSVPFLSPFLFPFPHQFVGYSWIRQALTSPSTPVLLFLQKSFSSIFPSSQSFCHDQELLWMAKADGYTDIQTA